MNGMRECREGGATPLGRRSVESRGAWGYLPARLGISASRRLVFRDVAQSGSAPEWGSGGRGFKSRRPDLSKYEASPEVLVRWGFIVIAARPRLPAAKGYGLLCAQLLAGGMHAGQGAGRPVRASVGVIRGSRGTRSGSSAAGCAHIATMEALLLRSSKTSLSKLSRFVCHV